MTQIQGEATTTNQSSSTPASSLLVVDDNSMNRIMLSRYITKLGYRAALTENGRQALEKLQGEPFDLVLLDVEMPEMDGYQVLEYIKADTRLRDIPVIMISAVEELESVVKCIELGAQDYLPKPFNPVLLRARLTACLERKRLRARKSTTCSRWGELQQQRQPSRPMPFNRKAWTKWPGAAMNWGNWRWS